MRRQLFKMWSSSKGLSRQLLTALLPLLVLLYLLAHFLLPSYAASYAPFAPIAYLQALGVRTHVALSELHKDDNAPLHARTKRDVVERASGPTVIPITAALPSISDLGTSSPLRVAWTSALDSLTPVASSLTSSGISRIGLKGKIFGIPGTGIDTNEEARELQKHLDCMSGEGEWVYDAKGVERERSGSAGLTVHKQEGIYASCDKRFHKGSSGKHDDGEWSVRESLKWRWVPSPSCAATLRPDTPSPPSPLSRRAFCTLLAHKSTLVVGDTPQYSLHDLLLDWTSLEPQSCYGDLYCKEHALCGDVLRASKGVEDWDEDERVYQRLPTPPGSDSSHDHSHDERDLPSSSSTSSTTSSTSSDPSLSKRQLSKKPKSVSYGTLLRYRRSDGLRPSTAQTIPTYIHPTTGIREINQQWVADSRRSDLVLLSKPPLPLPATGHNATWDEWWEESLVDEGVRMIEAARRITEEVWLPELLDTLRAIRGKPSPLDQLIVYRGGWRSHADCGASSLPPSAEATWDWNSPGDGPPPHTSQPDLSTLLFRAGTGRLTNPHTLFFNLQTILQNHLVRTVVLPAFGIPFLDLETTLSIWRSGMVGSSASTPFSLVNQNAPGGGGGAGVGMRSGASGDCSRYCVPSPGMAVEETVIGGLMRVFERGWAGTVERREEWVGEGFVKVTERGR